MRRELARNPIAMVEDYAAVPQGPGLGVELNEEIVGRYTARL